MFGSDQSISHRGIREHVLDTRQVVSIDEQVLQDGRVNLDSHLQSLRRPDRPMSVPPVTGIDQWERGVQDTPPALTPAPGLARAQGPSPSPASQDRHNQRFFPDPAGDQVVHPGPDAGQGARPDVTAIVRKTFARFNLSLSDFDHLEALVQGGYVVDVQQTARVAEELGASPKASPPPRNKQESRVELPEPAPGIPNAFQSPPVRPKTFDISSPAPGDQRLSQQVRITDMQRPSDQLESQRIKSNGNRAERRRDCDAVIDSKKCNSMPTRSSPRSTTAPAVSRRNACPPKARTRTSMLNPAKLSDKVSPHHMRARLDIAKINKKNEKLQTWPAGREQ